MMLFLLFIAVPLLEIYLFIKVGAAIGAISTVLLIILTAIIGVFLLRVQSIDTFLRFRNSIARDGMVGYEMLEAVFLLVGGLLLLTPGFFTDAVGLLCLLRTSRIWMIRMIAQHKFFGVVSLDDNGDFIEGRFRRDDDDDSRQ